MNENDMQIKDAIEYSINVLTLSDSKQIDSEMLLCFVLKCNRTKLYTHSKEELSNQNKNIFKKLVKKRAKGCPIAYITNEKEFWSHTLFVNESTLIPRPETELIVDIVLSLKSRYRQSRIVEPCVGSGAISIALAKNIPEAQVEVTDISSKCLMIARQNACLNGISNINLYKECNLLDGIEGDIDIIVSNPPYIETALLHTLGDEIQFEPTTALDGGYSGLEVITDLLSQAQEKISHFPDALINIHKDLGLLERVVSIELE